MYLEAAAVLYRDSARANWVMASVCRSAATSAVLNL